MDRFRGFWWAPDGQSLLVERYDDAAGADVARRRPGRAPTPAVEQRYPAAGTANADVTLWHVGLDGTAHRGRVGPRGVRVPRPGRRGRARRSPLQVLSAATSGTRRSSRSTPPRAATTTLVRELTDEAWVELMSAPRDAPGGRLVTLEDATARQTLFVDGTPSPPTAGRSARSSRSTPTASIATASEEPDRGPGRPLRLRRGGHPLTEGAAVHGGRDRRRHHGRHPGRPRVTGPTVTVTLAGPRGSIRVLAEPARPPRGRRFLRRASDAIRTAVLFPRDHEPGSRRCRC